MKKSAIRWNLLTLLAVIVCVGLTMLSPRFGYGLDGRAENGERAPFYYERTEKDGNARLDFYRNRAGVIMSLRYDSLFLGERTWTYGNEPPQTATVQVDGGLRNATNHLSRFPASSTGFPVVFRDAGGFLFLVYLVPLALILAARFLYPVLQKRSKKAAIIALSVLAVTALLIAARVDTLLILIGA